VPYWPPVNEQNTLITSALRVIHADHYNDPANPYEDAEREYAAEQLALAARSLTTAVSGMPPADQPLGWHPTTGTVRHVYLDTEFLRNDLTPRGLVSIALTDDDNNDYYAVNYAMDDKSVHDDPWMRNNVWPYLPHTEGGHFDYEHPDVHRWQEIRDQIAAYFTDTTAETTYLYANHGAQDVVRLHGLWDHDWSVMPDAIPRWFTDIKGLIAAAGLPDGTIPKQEAGAHHPLEDARYNRYVRQFLVGA
jgi:hypothetical protein